MSQNIATTLRKSAAQMRKHGWTLTAAAVPDELERAAVEIERLRTALCFYANPSSYNGLPPGYAFVPIDKDSGELARAALNED